MQDHIYPKDTDYYPAYPAIKRVINRALIVDDDLNIRALVSFYLKKICDSEFAESGLQALEAVNRSDYDLILMDIELGYGMNGVEASREIRQLSDCRDVPIIAMTSSVEPGIRKKCLDVGMDAFLSKPFYKHTLLDEIEHVIKENNK